jgi:putative ABC transport system permease protein
LDHPQQDQSLRRILFESSAVPSDQPMLVTTSAVTSDYFHVLGMTLLRGRQFEIFDDENSPSVAIVNESMAQAYWPNDDAIGKRLKLSPRATSWTTVVGVVADARTESPTTARVPHLYASLYQLQGKHLAIFVKGRIETAALANAVREQVQSLNSALPVFGEETLSATVAASLAERRLSMELIASFALTALLLAALGIYGVTSYMVNERTQEIGLRIALGAQRRDVMRMVMRQGVRLAIAGAVLGMGGALLVSRAMAGLLIGVNGTDPLILSAAVLLLTAVAIAGCWIPARRAVRIDPISALG